MSDESVAGPIVLVALLAGAGAVTVGRVTENVRYGLAAGALILALAAGAFGAIATVGLVAALVLLLVSGALYMSARSE